MAGREIAYWLALLEESGQKPSATNAAMTTRSREVRPSEVISPIQQKSQENLNRGLQAIGKRLESMADKNDLKGLFSDLAKAYTKGQNTTQASADVASVTESRKQAAELNGSLGRLSKTLDSFRQEFSELNKKATQPNQQGPSQNQSKPIPPDPSKNTNIFEEQTDILRQILSKLSKSQVTEEDILEEAQHQGRVAAKRAELEEQSRLKAEAEAKKAQAEKDRESRLSQMATAGKGFTSSLLMEMMGLGFLKGGVIQKTFEDFLFHPLRSVGDMMSVFIKAAPYAVLAAELIATAGKIKELSDLFSDTIDSLKDADTKEELAANMKMHAIEQRNKERGKIKEHIKAGTASQEELDRLKKIDEMGKKASIEAAKKAEADKKDQEENGGAFSNIAHAYGLDLKKTLQDPLDQAGALINTMAEWSVKNPGTAAATAGGTVAATAAAMAIKTSVVAAMTPVTAAATTATAATTEVAAAATTAVTATTETVAAATTATTALQALAAPVIALTTAVIAIKKTSDARAEAEQAGDDSIKQMSATTSAGIRLDKELIAGLKKQGKSNEEIMKILLSYQSGEANFEAQSKDEAEANKKRESFSGLNKFDKGTPYVQKTGPAIIHEGEAIIPAAMNDRRTQAAIKNFQNFNKDKYWKTEDHPGRVASKRIPPLDQKVIDQVYLTGYTPGVGDLKMEGTGITSIGDKAKSVEQFKAGQVPYVSAAVDPRVFPYGTILGISSLPGVPLIASDTGSAIQGTHIDVAFSNASNANKITTNQGVVTKMGKIDISKVSNKNMSKHLASNMGSFNPAQVGVESPQQTPGILSSIGPGMKSVGDMLGLGPQKATDQTLGNSPSVDTLIQAANSDKGSAITSPGKQCAKGVRLTLEKLGIKGVQSDSAYQMADKFARHPQFSEFQVGQSWEAVKKLPPGTVLVYNKSAKHPDGHVSIITAPGKEMSDIPRNIVNPQFYGGVRAFSLTGAAQASQEQMATKSSSMLDSLKGIGSKAMSGASSLWEGAKSNIPGMSTVAEGAATGADALKSITQGMTGAVNASMMDRMSWRDDRNGGAKVKPSNLKSGILDMVGGSGMPPQAPKAIPKADMDAPIDTLKEIIAAKGKEAHQMVQQAKAAVQKSQPSQGTPQSMRSKISPYIDDLGLGVLQTLVNL